MLSGARIHHPVTRNRTGIIRVMKGYFFSKLLLTLKDIIVYWGHRVNVDLSINFNFRTNTDDISFDDVVYNFNYLSNELGDLLSTQPVWYETGYSRKQALNSCA